MAFRDDSMDPMDRRKALVDALGGGADPLMNVSNPAAPVALAPTEAQTPLLPSDLPSGPSGPAQDFGRLNAGYDTTKLNDPNKQSAKYVMGRTLSAFDPTQGITPDALKALNSLGYGTFSGSGDKLSLSGLTDAGRGAGLTGDYRDADFVQGLHGGNGKWSYADPTEEARQAAASPPLNAGGMMTPTSIAPMLQGDAGLNIQHALSNSGLNTDNRLQQLIAALQQGGVR